MYIRNCASQLRVLFLGEALYYQTLPYENCPSPTPCNSGGAVNQSRVPTYNSGHRTNDDQS